MEAVQCDENAVRLVDLMPMPKILEGTSSPSPKSAIFDEDGKRAGWVSDPDNKHWTPEVYAERKAEHETAWAKSKACMAATGHSDWYSWATSDENWGTKWGDSETYLEAVSESCASGHYETAWSPLSENFWLHVSREFPELSIVVSYHEEGMCFEGGMAFKGGECYYDECTEAAYHATRAHLAIEGA